MDNYIGVQIYISIVHKLFLHKLLKACLFFSRGLLLTNHVIQAVLPYSACPYLRRISRMFKSVPPIKRTVVHEI